MFISKVVPRVCLLSRVSGALQVPGQLTIGSVPVQTVLSANCPFLNSRLRNYSTAADNTQPPRWVQLEPELDEALVPRKMSVSPLESWLSLRYSLPPLLEAPQALEDGELKEETRVLPPFTGPHLEDQESSAPLSCKNVLEIRRRKMNRHKYKKLLKRTKFLRRSVLHGRRKRKQKRFEKDLERIWTRAGLKKAPEGWTTPKIFIKQQGNKRD